MYPVNAPITQPFGANPLIYRQYGLKGHEGYDFGCWNGTQVRAQKGGWVGVASLAYGNYGTCIILRHPDGTGTIYAHLQRIDVKAGQWVNPGQQIALSNNTGNSSGPHLHFGYQPAYLQNLNNGYWGCAPYGFNEGGPAVDERYAEDWARLAYLYYLGREPTREERRARINLPWDQALNAIANSAEAQAYAARSKSTIEKQKLIDYINNN